MFPLSFPLMKSSTARTPAADQRGEMLVTVRQNHALAGRVAATVMLRGDLDVIDHAAVGTD